MSDREVSYIAINNNQETVSEKQASKEQTSQQRTLSIKKVIDKQVCKN